MGEGGRIFYPEYEMSSRVHAYETIGPQLVVFVELLEDKAIFYEIVNAR